MFLEILYIHYVNFLSQQIKEIQKSTFTSIFFRLWMYFINISYFDISLRGILQKEFFPKSIYMKRQTGRLFFHLVKLILIYPKASYPDILTNISVSLTLDHIVPYTALLLSRRNDSSYLQNRLNRKVNVMSTKVKTVNRCKTLQKCWVLKDASSVKINIKILVHNSAYNPEIGLDENIHI